MIASRSGTGSFFNAATSATVSSFSGGAAGSAPCRRYAMTRFLVLRHRLRTRRYVRLLGGVLCPSMATPASPASGWLRRRPGSHPPNGWPLRSESCMGVESPARGGRPALPAAPGEAVE